MPESEREGRERGGRATWPERRREVTEGGGVSHKAREKERGERGGSEPRG